MRKEELTAAVKAAFVHTLPVMAGYMVLGFGFGLLLQSKGIPPIIAPLMSIFIFAGSMQYVAVDLIATGAGIISSAIMTLMINGRHIFYGLSMLIRYRDIGRVKPYLIFGLTDETYSLVSNLDPPEGIGKDAFYFAITALDQSYWVLGTVLGVAFGQAVHINTTGVEFSMTALFTVIAVDNFLDKKKRIPLLIGIGVSVICLLIFGPSDFLIPSMIGIAAALMLVRPLLEEKEVF